MTIVEGSAGYIVLNHVRTVLTKPELLEIHFYFDATHCAVMKSRTTEEHDANVRDLAKALREALP